MAISGHFCGPLGSYHRLSQQVFLDRCGYVRLMLLSSRATQRASCSSVCLLMAKRPMTLRWGCAVVVRHAGVDATLVFKHICEGTYFEEYMAGAGK